MYRSFRLFVLTTILWSSAMLANCKESDSTNFETVHNSNAAILHRLGLAPVRIPEGHHKKRLAGPEPSGLGSSSSRTRIHQPYSRRHGHRDSHVYIVKLPASQPYYTLTKPHKPASINEQDKITKPTRITNVGSSPQVGFHSNGKPGKIYHWNLPIMKKMTEKKRLHSQLRIDQMRKKLEAEMNDQNHQHQHNTKIHDEEEHKNKMFADTAVKPAPISVTKKPINFHFDVKRYHHFTSENSLNHEDKPFKHTRNNDKRLNYPKVTDDLRNSGRPENLSKLGRKNNTTSNKMYRFEDSNLYRLGASAGHHSNDRLAGWRLSNELHASRNTPNGQKAKKQRKKAAMSYYAPINAPKIDDTTSIHKNFPGNGKPKGFYVMEKSRQPVYYHPLLP